MIHVDMHAVCFGYVPLAAMEILGDIIKLKMKSRKKTYFFLFVFFLNLQCFMDEFSFFLFFCGIKGLRN